MVLFRASRLEPRERDGGNLARHCEVLSFCPVYFRICGYYDLERSTERRPTSTSHTVSPRSVTVLFLQKEIMLVVERLSTNGTKSLRSTRAHPFASPWRLPAAAPLLYGAMRTLEGKRKEKRGRRKTRLSVGNPGQYWPHRDRVVLSKRDCIHWLSSSYPVAMSCDSEAKRFSTR